jgi:hypothetical protein
MYSPEINLDLGATVEKPFALSSAGSTPNRDKDKYPMDDIIDPTPYTLMYVKDRRKWPKEGEWEPIKIPHRNLSYIPETTRRPFLLTRPKLSSYR